MSEDKVKQVTVLSEEEVAARAKTLTAKMLERDLAADALRMHNAEARENLKALDAIIHELADQVRTGTETAWVERQPGLFDGTEGDGPPDDEDGPDGDDLSGAGAGWTEGTNPQPIIPDDTDTEPPPDPPDGALITDPSGLLGPEAETRGRRRRKGSEAAP